MAATRTAKRGKVGRAGPLRLLHALLVLRRQRLRRMWRRRWDAPGAVAAARNAAAAPEVTPGAAASG